MTLVGNMLAVVVVSAVLLGGAVLGGVVRPTVPEAFALPTAQEGSQRATLVVTGSGEASSEPDQAIVNVGATAVAPTAEAAIGDVNRRVGAVVDSVKAQGVADRDLRTSGISLQPIQRNRPSGDQSPPEIEAYRASNTLTITVRDASRAGAVLDAATSAGANVIGGLQFALANPDRLRGQALANAVRAARAAAEEMARAANVQLGEIIAITDESGGGPVPLAQTAVARAESATPVQPGELTTHARARLTFAIAS
jgi:uncharacterized protein YggE